MVVREKWVGVSAVIIKNDISKRMQGVDLIFVGFGFKMVWLMFGFWHLVGKIAFQGKFKGKISSVVKRRMYNHCKFLNTV